MYIDTMAATTKYSLSQITDISFSGFDYTISDDTIAMINYLSGQVGFVSNISSNVFNKKPSVVEPENNFKQGNKKRKGKAVEISAEEWESIRTFEATAISKKTGLDAEIDQVRLCLNKITDKTFLDMREKLIAQIDKICSIPGMSIEDGEKISREIYNVSSSNKFYSRIFSDLYAELVTKYVWMRPEFNRQFENIMENYKNITYIDPETNYDEFCRNNAINEKRRAMTLFFVNLALNGFISKLTIVKILKELLETVIEKIEKSDVKFLVDEITENIGILYNKDLLEEVESYPDYEEDDYLIDDRSIIETVTMLAKYKTKDYPSLSNKSIFKFMDLVEM